VRKWTPTDKAKDRLNDLSANLEGRIQSDLAQDPDKSRHMPFVLYDIGQTNRGIKRLDKHLDCTDNANKTMAPFALAAKAKGFREYLLHADYIFVCFREI
jgi:hypothetical protein